MARNIILVLIVLLLASCIPSGKKMQTGEIVAPPVGWVDYQKRSATMP